MPLTIDEVIQFGPALCGIIVFILLYLVHYFKIKETTLVDLLRAAILAGFLLPAAAFLIYSIFDNSVITKLSGVGYYLGAAGIFLFINFFFTVKEKL